MSRPLDIEAETETVPVVLITGPSGAGRSTAIARLEDLGYEAIDNLPLSLVPRLLSGPPMGAPVAIGVDTRTRDFSVLGLIDMLGALRAASNVSPTLLYLDCDADVLLRRFSETRRRHPLAVDSSVSEAIATEREQLAGARADADIVIDTTDLNPHQLRDRLTTHFTEDEHDEAMRITLTSFGFKHGLPLDVDIVLDCRFLPNPHWEDDLRPLSGLDPEIQEYVLDRDLTQQFLAHLTAMLDELLPAYDEEGKSYLTIAFGCTGGRHRSVAVAEGVGRILKDRGWRPRVSHRDINRP